MIQKIPIKDTRANLADLVNQVEVAGKRFIITKFGKPRAMLVPVITDRPERKRASKRLPGFGLWADREDMKDPEKWVGDLRKKWARRYA